MDNTDTKRSSTVAEPAATYTKMPVGEEAPQSTESRRMTVEEYFGELRDMVNDYYENLQS